MRSVRLAINIGAIAAFLATTLALQIPRLHQKLVGQTLESDLKDLEREKTRLQILNQLPAGGLGFNNLIADFVYLQYLQYFGDDIARQKHKTGFGLSPDYFQIIIKRDPRHVYSYLFMSTGVSMFAAQPRKAIELYKLGLPFISPETQYDAYTVWRRKALDEFLFLGDSASARQSYLKAAEYADRATFPPDALPETKFVAQASRDSAEFLRKDPNSKPARIAAWTTVLQGAVDKKTAQIAVNELDQLGMKVIIDSNGALKVIKK